MKSTGIVRRIDDLGRVIIPKEIRRTLRIREGDPLEIFVDTKSGEVTFKKYNLTETYEEGIDDIIRSITDDSDLNCPEVIDLLEQARDGLEKLNKQSK